MDREELLALLKTHLKLSTKVKWADQSTKEVTVTLQWVDARPSAEEYLTEISSTSFYVD